MYNYNNIKNNLSGYSLTEVMFSLAIFALLMTSVLGIAKSVSEGQKAAIAAQNTQESIRFAFEVMSKEIRSARQSDGVCNPDFNGIDTYEVYNEDTLGGADRLYFKNKNQECVYYYLELDADGISHLKIARDDNLADLSIDNDFFITPNDVNVTNLEFYVNDNVVGDDYHLDIQPLVTIKLELESAGNKYKQDFIMQTSVSSRHY